MIQQQFTFDFETALELGEGQFIEFKESFDKSLPKEMVAFANASGGVIYLGITDSGKTKGIEITNRLKSQLQDIAYNCDPSIIVNLIEINNILAIEIAEGKTNLIHALTVSLCVWGQIPRK